MPIRIITVPFDPAHDLFQDEDPSRLGAVSGDRGDAIRISSDRRRFGRRKPKTRLRFLFVLHN